MSLLAVDIGSSSCKAIAFAADGTVLAQRTSASYSPEFPQPGFAEINPEVFWDALCSCSHEVTKLLSDPVQAICLSSHGETFVPVDSRRRPVWNAILNQDSRALPESDCVAQVIGREKLFEITGHFAHPMFPIAKILWLKKHQPEVFSRTASFVTVIGFLLQKLGLPAYADYSLASRFLAFDIRKKCWSDEILSAVDVDRKLLPETSPAGIVVGKLSMEASSRLLVQAGTPVVLGGHDQPCGAVGLGVVDDGRVCDSMGTYECLLAASASPAINQQALASSLNTYCHVVPDRFVTLAYFPSGIMVKWFHDLLHDRSDSRESDDYAQLESNAPARPTGLCILPHLIGTCNPEFDPSARGVISGLNPAINRGHMYKGILEGVACELALLTNVLADATGAFHDIYVAGGGTRSALGLQLRAALTGCNLHVMKQQESVCQGSAILAGVAIREYASVREAVSALVKESAIVPADAQLAGAYKVQMQNYRRLRSVMVHHA